MPTGFGCQLAHDTWQGVPPPITQDNCRLSERREKKKKSEALKPLLTTGRLISPLHFQSLQDLRASPIQSVKKHTQNKVDESILNLILHNMTQNKVNLFQCVLHKKKEKKKEARSCISGDIPIFYSSIRELFLCVLLLD